MIIKKIIDLCKKSGHATLFNAQDGQWISDGSAIYPLYDMPVFDELTLCSTFDITKKQREKISVHQLNGLPPAIDFGDIVDNEAECQEINITIAEGKRVLVPYITAKGVTYFDKRYFDPFVGSDTLKLYERVTEKGNSYYVIKIGFELQAVVTPYDAITTDLVDRLELLHKLTAVALENKQLHIKQQMENALAMEDGEEMQ